MGRALKLPDLAGGTLLKRYKRFLADLELDDGSFVTAHCPNTGAMTGCAEPGSRAWVSRSDNAKRKYPLTLEFVETQRGPVSVNTGRANLLAGEALRQGRVLPELSRASASAWQAEVAIPEGDGRFDFALVDDERAIYVEVKSVTLLRGDGLGLFPDAVSARALKHVQALVRRVAAGDRGVLLFCAQHCGIDRVGIARDIDPAYAEAVEDAVARGVEVFALGCTTDLDTMQISGRLPFAVDAAELIR